MRYIFCPVIFHIIDISGEKFSNKGFTEGFFSTIAHDNGIFTFVANRHQFYALTSGEGGDVIIELKNEDDYYNLSEIYQSFIGGNLGWCEDCSNEYFRSGRNQKYCDRCSAKRRKELSKKTMAKVRDT